MKVKLLTRILLTFICLFGLNLANAAPKYFIVHNQINKTSSVKFGHNKGMWSPYIAKPNKVLKVRWIEVKKLCKSTQKRNICKVFVYASPKDSRQYYVGEIDVNLITGKVYVRDMAKKPAHKLLMVRNGEIILKYN